MRRTAADLTVLLLGLTIGAAAFYSDPYLVLGLNRDAGDAEIRRKYRSLALQYHPDKNPSPAAMERWLRVQQAYAALTDKAGGGSVGSASHPFSPADYQRYYQQQQQRQNQQQQQRGGWQSFWQAPRPPPHIHSDTETLDAAGFSRHVLSSSGTGSSGGSGTAWLVQLYADSSPYCRVLSRHWEAAARDMGGLVRFGRIDAAAQPMLVRFLASHLRLFSTQQPQHELPAVFGLPAGCAAMRCAVVFTGRFTAAGLQRFAATQLLRVAPLALLSLRLLGAWRRAVPPGRLALLVLLPEGQQQPLALLAAVKKAQGRLHVAQAVWRPADRALWAEAVGATSAPALVFWKVSSHSSPPVVVQGSLMTNSIDYAAEVERHSWPLLSPLHAGTVEQLPACRFGSDDVGGDSRAAGAATGVGQDASAPPGALCLLLLGRSGQQAMDTARQAVEALQQQLAGGCGRRQGSTEMRLAAKLVAEKKVQMAWADAAQQRLLCRHLLLWSGSSAANSSCLCGPWWQRLPAAALGRCRGGTQPPVLLTYRQQLAGSSGRSSGQLLVAAYGGRLTDQQQVAAWLVEVAAEAGGQQQQQRLLLPAPLAAVHLAEESVSRHIALLLQAMHLASQAEVLYQQAAAVVGRALPVVSGRQLLLLALLAAAVVALKQLLDFLSGEGEDGDGNGSSPSKRPTPDLHAARGSGAAGDGSSWKAGRRTSSTASGGGGGGSGSSSSSGRLLEMHHSDWDPSPGRFIVLLPLTAGGSTTGVSSTKQQQSVQQKAAQQQLVQQQRKLFAALAAVFQPERRLAFRVAAMSGACEQLFAASALPPASPAAVVESAGAAAAGPGRAEGSSNWGTAAGQERYYKQQQADQQQAGQQQAVAFVLHPRRERFQVLPLRDLQQVVLRLEEVLDGGGQWRQAAT